jgi:hypothetical protein
MDRKQASGQASATKQYFDTTARSRDDANGLFGTKIR